MRFVFCSLVIAALLIASPAFARSVKKNVAKNQPAPAAAQAVAAQAGAGAQTSQEEAQRQELITNITTLRNQEIRAAVLQQLLNEEAGKLMNTQAVFCDRYKLDVEKWRQGLYRYDEKTQKFVVQPDTKK
jgi:hypothetical protein